MENKTIATLKDHTAKLASHTTTLATHGTGLQTVQTDVSNLGVRAKVNTIADLPGNGGAGELHFVIDQNQFYVWRTGSASWTPSGLPAGSMPTGTVFPTTDLTGGRMFYRIDLDILFAYSTVAQAWVQK